MSDVIFGNYKSGYVLFEDSVVRALNQWRQSTRLPEAGGILIGYRRMPHLHVVAYTTPMKKDQRSRKKFWRKDPRHAAVAKQWWKQSDAEAYYLGEWHTHPQDYPTPSFIDERGWNKLIKSQLGPDLLFLIIGKENWYLQREYYTLSHL